MIWTIYASSALTILIALRLFLSGPQAATDPLQLVGVWVFLGLSLFAVGNVLSSQRRRIRKLEHAQDENGRHD